jgi:hypothetical protein
VLYFIYIHIISFVLLLVSTTRGDPEFHACATPPRSFVCPEIGKKGAQIFGVFSYILFSFQ